MGPSLTGQTLGKYHILAEIGRGGMGTVYKAHDTVLDRVVAIKVLAPHLAGNEEFVQRFLHEARSAGRLDHPHIVTIHDVAQVAGYSFIVMKYLEGRSLAEILRREGPLAPERTVRILAQIAEALDYAHARGLVHRDVKPGNILVDTQDQATLTDFGIARGGEGTRLTQAGMVIGTPAYMAPEQVKGTPVGPPTDVYALGVVAYEMLGGRPPFEGDTSRVLFAHVYEAPPPLPQLNPKIPPALGAVVQQALAKEPGERFGSAGAFVAALRQVLEPDKGELARPGVVLESPPGPATAPRSMGRPPRRPPTTPVPGMPRPGLTQPWLLFGALGAVGLIGILGAMVLVAVLVKGPGGSGGKLVTPSPIDSSLSKAGIARQTQTASGMTPVPPIGTARRLTATPPPAPSPTVYRIAEGEVAYTYTEDFSKPAGHWGEESDEDGSRAFKDGKYHIRVTSPDLVYWSTAGGNFSDFVLEVEATQVEGPNDNDYGVLVRYVDGDNFYRFKISGDGYYGFDKQEKGEWVTILKWTQSAAIKKGRATNVLKIVCKGNQFVLYVNGVKLASPTDGSFTSGDIGLVVGTFEETGVHISFDNLKMWALK